MPDTSENPTNPGGRGPSHAAPRAERSSSRERRERGGAPPIPPKAGALFRALLRAGCDTDTAYTAAEEAKRMAGENVMARIDATLTRLADDVGKLAIKVDRLSEKVDRHGEILADHGTKLEVLAVRMDGLQREMRLMWGALGALVTVLGLVFTLLFSR